MTVMVVEDDPTVGEVVTTYLEHAGFAVRRCIDGESALEVLAAQSVDLVLLDVMLPGIDGLEVCRRIREVDAMPVVMLTAKGDETDRVLGLELGADDYVTKPFSPRELVLRVQSILRRTSGLADSGQTPRILEDGELRLDVDAHQAWRSGRRLALTSREFDLLAFLMANPGTAFTRADLMAKVWGWQFGDQSTVTVHVRRLREKTERDPAVPEHLKTVWGVGYRWDTAAGGR
jgi:DNA-binding response OmpR family regulator